VDDDAGEFDFDEVHGGWLLSYSRRDRRCEGEAEPRPV
jgi:hypothetical protein